MKTINVKVSGEKTEVKLFKKFKVLDFNLAIVDFPHRDGSYKTVVEFNTGIGIGFLRSHKKTIKDIEEKSSLYFMDIIKQCGEKEIIDELKSYEVINN